jgi:hypothetical protein
MDASRRDQVIDATGRDQVIDACGRDQVIDAAGAGHALEATGCGRLAEAPLSDQGTEAATRVVSVRTMDRTAVDMIPPLAFSDDATAMGR